LIVYAALLVLSSSLLSADGDYWPWFAVTTIFAVIALAAGPRRYRFIGVAALALSVILIVSDYAAGEYRRKHGRALRRAFSEASVIASTIWGTSLEIDWLNQCGERVPPVFMSASEVHQLLATSSRSNFVVYSRWANAGKFTDP
jgi:hypothetical protein